MRRNRQFVLLVLVILTSIAKTISAKADINFSGDLSFILGYNYLITTDNKGEFQSAAPDYLNSYKWNLKLKITKNDNLGFGIRFSNPLGFYGEKIDNNLAWIKDSNNKFISLPEFYFKWNIKQLTITAGIIPVLGNTILDLVAYEMHDYNDVGTYSWKYLMNNSQKGIDFCFDLVANDDLALAMKITPTLADDALGTDKADAFILDQMRILVAFPTYIKQLNMSLYPLMHIRTNAFRSSDYDKADHSISGGCDLNYSPHDIVTLKLGAAVGTFKNESQKDSVDTATAQPMVQKEPLGILLSTGLLYQPKIGLITLDFNFGRSRDRKSAPVLDKNLLFWDLKYELVFKKMTLIPRCRIWHYSVEDSDATITRLFPELELKADF